MVIAEPKRRMITSYQKLPTPHSKLVIFIELCGVLDGIFCVSHAFRSANSSSRSVYLFTAGSFAILSASSMAATVSLPGWLRDVKGNPPLTEGLADKNTECCCQVHDEFPKQSVSLCFQV